MIIVLRLGHRRERDKRVSTHCALVARAFGADKIIFSGERDEIVLESVRKVAGDWGGRFKVGYEADWEKVLKKFRGKIVHLTFYGLPLFEEISRIRKEKNLLVVVGAGKVPREVYDEADFNVSVTSQPHSEIAALAVFLHEFFDGSEVEKKFSSAKKTIFPSAKQKNLVKNRGKI